MKDSNFLFKAIEGKTVTWCSNENQYIVLENITADIIKSLNKEIPIKAIAKALTKKIDATSFSKDGKKSFSIEKKNHLSLSEMEIKAPLMRVYQVGQQVIKKILLENLLNSKLLKHL